MRTYLNFLYKKATQAINFFAEQQNGTVDKLAVLKLIYFAERYHIRKFGRSIINDEFFAMQHGPVASGVKDLAEMSFFCDTKEKDYASVFIDSGKEHIKSLKECDLNIFSDSDIEALKFSWDTFGHLKPYELANLTHEYPEWKKHELSLENTSRVRMYIEDFLEDPVSKDVNPCHPLSKDEKKELIEQLDELNYLESIWS